MTMKLAEGIDVKRSDRFHLKPEDIIICPELRGRHTPPTNEQVAQLAISMHKNSQIEPVLCRRTHDNRVKLVAGFTRHEAAKMLRQGFEYDDKSYCDPEFRLSVVLSDCNDEEAFLRNLAENNDRCPTSAIDDAHNQRRLRETYGKNDVEIAEIYGVSSVKVGQYRKLLELSNDEQALVHKGLLAVSAALTLLNVSSEERAQIVADATKENGKVDGSAIRVAVREVLTGPETEETEEVEDTNTSEVVEDATGEVPPAPPDPPRGKNLGRSVRDIRKWGESLKDNEELSDAVRHFGGVLLQYLAGRKGEKALMTALSKLEEVPTKKAA